MKFKNLFILMLCISCSHTKRNDLKFSNTMKWHPDMWNMSSHPYSVLSETDKFELPSPPSNDSDETRKELDYMLAQQDRRNDIDEKEIISQLKLSEFRFDCLQIKDIEDKTKKNLSSLVEYYYLDLIGTIMRQKKIYDRVRASYLDKRIKPVVPNPGHPSYPSGHATETYFHAHLFAELNPERADYYFRDANRISKNREMAGVHYPSDTEGGRSLGKQVFEAMKKRPKFVEMLNKARPEFLKISKCR